MRETLPDSGNSNKNSKRFVEKGTTVIALDGFIDVDPAFAEKADKWYVGNEKTDRAEIIDSKAMSHGIPLSYGCIWQDTGPGVGGRDHRLHTYGFRDL